jgi:hypothetical protein
MEKIKVIHDRVGQTLTVWLGDPATEVLSEETTEEVVLMKNKLGQVIGFELLHYENQHPDDGNPRLAVETVVKTGTR